MSFSANCFSFFLGYRLAGAGQNEKSEKCRKAALTDGADSKTDGADSKTDGTDSKTDGTDSKTDGTDSKTDGTDSNRRLYFTFCDDAL